MFTPKNETINYEPDLPMVKNGSPSIWLLLIQVCEIERGRHSQLCYKQTKIISSDLESSEIGPKTYLKQVKPLKLTAEAYRNPCFIIERAISRIRRNPKTE